MVDTPSVEERKLLLEERKFEWEKHRSSRWLNSNFGVVITAIVGLGTISVSLIQLEISKKSAEAQLAQQIKTSTDQLELDRQKANAADQKEIRAFRLDLAKILIERASDLNTQDEQRVPYLRSIFADVLPSDVGLPFLSRMANNAPSEHMKSIWSGIYVEAAAAAQGAATAGVSQKITIAYLTGLFPKLATGERNTRLADLLDAIHGSELQSDNEIAVFLSIVFGEVGLFDYLTESFDFTAHALMVAFPSRFPTLNDAQDFAGKPDVIANKLYGTRLGNREPGDGWTFRGRGYLQVTGRNNYIQAGKALGLDLVANPDLLLESKTSARLAVSLYLQAANGSDKSNLIAMWKRINGGPTGVASAQNYYQKIVPTAPNLTSGLVNP